MTRVDTYDVAVVGAGPAGAMAALICAKRGDSVLLIDKQTFPREKTCGCCLSAAALSEIRSAGLSELINHCAAPIGWITLACAGARTTLELAPMFAMSRAVLDTALTDAATSFGATFVRASARLGDLRDGGRELRLRKQDDTNPKVLSGETNKIRAKVVLIATGLASGILDDQPRFESVVEKTSRMGASAIFSEGPPSYEGRRLYMAVGQHGYAGLVRLEDGRLNVATAFDPSFVRAHGGVGRAVSTLIEHSGLPVWNALAESRWHGTPLLTRRREQVCAPRLLVLGDAAGYAEPFTGEGMGWAMADGAAAARLIGLPWNDNTPRQWMQYHRESVMPRQRRCRMIARLLRHASLAAPMLRVLSRFPGIGALLLPHALS